MPEPDTNKSAPRQLKPSSLHRFHAGLLAWYATHGRHDLPWRQTPDPYRIWVSEVMLQQTQVETVKARFYGPFLQRFPTIAALADAPREAVLKAWEGLGYYRRAGYLHDAAKQLVLEGGVPPPFAAADAATHALLERWLALPGIGRNTAHAILAFGYRQPYAVMEANVKRIVARVFARATPSDAELWAGAEMLLNTQNPFDYNQAMMDMGAMICTPKNPQCGICPAATLCAGKATPESYPAPKARKKIPTKHVQVWVETDGEGRIALAPRQDALLGGLYGFAQHAAEATRPRDAQPIGHVTHVYSHFRLEVAVYALRQPSRRNQCYSAAEIAALPLSGVDHKILQLFHGSVAKKRG